MTTRGEPGQKHTIKLNPRNACPWLKRELGWAWKGSRRLWIAAGAAWGMATGGAAVYPGALHLQDGHQLQGWTLILAGTLMGMTITMVNWWMERRSP